MRGCAISIYLEIGNTAFLPIFLSLSCIVVQSDLIIIFYLDSVNRMPHNPNTVPRRGSRIQKGGGGGFVQEFRLENRSYPDVHDFSLRMQVIIAND